MGHVSWYNIDIQSSVAANCVLPAIVNAHDSEGKVLHLVLEAEDIGIVLNEVYNHLISGLFQRVDKVLCFSLLLRQCAS